MGDDQRSLCIISNGKVVLEIEEKSGNFTCFPKTHDPQILELESLFQSIFLLFLRASKIGAPE